MACDRMGSTLADASLIIEMDDVGEVVNIAMT
jgi:hypothetical protein